MTPTNDLKVDLRRTVADLRRLVYEIRQDVRAAGVEARKRWKLFLEPQLSKTEKLMRELAEVSRTAVQSTAAALGDFNGGCETPAGRRAHRAAKGRAIASRRQADAVRAEDFPIR